MSKGYYDIDAILTAQELIPSRFCTNADLLGHLDSGCDERDLRVGTQLELPFWLARELAKRKMVQLDLPKIFSPRYRATLQADPAVVNLQEWCSNFFDFGVQITELVADEELEETLRKAFTVRYRQIMDLALNALNEDTGQLTRKLDSRERKLFLAGHTAMLDFHRWIKRESDTLGTSEVLLASGRYASKRRRH